MENQPSYLQFQVRNSLTILKEKTVFATLLVTAATQNAKNNIGKTICGAAEKRGIEKAYNFFFHKQILECHKNNHTEKKKKKTPSLNELLQDADQNTTGWREESGLGKLKSRAMHGFYVFMCCNMVQTP